MEFPSKKKPSLTVNSPKSKFGAEQTSVTSHKPCKSVGKSSTTDEGKPKLVVINKHNSHFTSLSCGAESEISACQNSDKETNSGHPPACVNLSDSGEDSMPCANGGSKSQGSVNKTSSVPSKSPGKRKKFVLSDTDSDDLDFCNEQPKKKPAVKRKVSTVKRTGNVNSTALSNGEAICIDSSDSDGT